MEQLAVNMNGSFKSLPHFMYFLKQLIKVIQLVAQDSALVDKDFSCRLVGSICRVIIDLSVENCVAELLSHAISVLDIC